MTTTDGTTTDGLSSRIDDTLDDATRLRRDLHAHPELKFQEERTSAVVREHLDRLGIEHATGVGGETPGTGFGVVAHLPATEGEPGPCVALRADMDALPIEERTGAEYASTNPGVMHACGHDGHTTILLTAARILAQTPERPNPVTLVFQPAEEGGAGADKLIRDGLMDGSIVGDPIDRMYGLHGWPDETLGTVATRPGPLLAAADMFKMTIRGVQTHAAYPHAGRDPVLAGAAIVQAAQSIVSRSTKPTDAAVVSITRFHAGTAHNIIPERAELAGTIRSLSEDQRLFNRERFGEIATHTAKALGCDADLEWIPGYPVTMNDPGEAQRVLDAAGSCQRVLRTALVESPTLGGEDFAFYAARVPACFAFIGLNPDPGTPYPGLHTPGFDFNDDALGIGIEMMCRLALAEP